MRKVLSPRRGTGTSRGWGLEGLIQRGGVGVVDLLVDLDLSLQGPDLWERGTCGKAERVVRTGGGFVGFRGGF